MCNISNMVFYLNKRLIVHLFFVPCLKAGKSRRLSDDLYSCRIDHILEKLCGNGMPVARYGYGVSHKAKLPNSIPERKEYAVGR